MLEISSKQPTKLFIVFQSVVIFIFGILVPLGLFYLSGILFSPMEQSGHEASELLFGAKIVMLPLAIFAAVALLFVKCFRVKKYRVWHTVGLWSGVMVCGWTIVFAVISGYSSPEGFVIIFAAILVSAGFLAGYYLVAREVTEKLHRDAQNDAVIGFLLPVPFLPATIMYANKLFSELPEHVDCYVVSASQYAYPGFVRVVDIGGGKFISRQLLIFKSFELLLQDVMPRAHGRVRKIYNIYGPRLARYIARDQRRATISYLVLKPVEHLFLAILRAMK